MMVLALAAAFLLGTFPTGLLVVRALKGIDLRTTGSGNIGATNVVRAVGWGWGISTLLFDALKGAAVPLLLAYGPVPAGVPWQILAGLLALTGNILNPFLRFKGGKGVGTALGVTFAIAPTAALIGVAGFFAGFLPTRIVSVGSLSGCAAFAATALVQYLRTEPSPHWVWLAFCMTLPVLVVLTHRANIRRLMAGTETRLTRQK